MLSKTIASSVTFCPFPAACGTLGQGGNNPLPSKYYSPQIVIPGSSGVCSPARVEGTESRLGAKVWAVQRLLLEEGILKSSKWLSSQICAEVLVGQWQRHLLHYESLGHPFLCSLQAGRLLPTHAHALHTRL